MGLQRFDHWAEIGAAGLAAEVMAVESCDGEYYLAADVDALLARIRAAVEHVVSVAPDWWVDYDYEQGDKCRSCGASRDKTGWRCYQRDLAHRDGCQRAALDALLAEGECSSLCAPGSGER